MFSKTSKRVTMIGLTVIMLCLFISPAFSSGATTYPARTIDVKMLYDKSYEAFIEDRYDITVESRIDQIVEYAAFPFDTIWNIEVVPSIAPYSSVLGTEYSLQFTYPNSCTNLWSWGSGNDTKYVPVWRHNGQCACVANSQCYNGLSNPSHHNSGRRYIYELQDYMENARNYYDSIMSIFGHKLCYVYSDTNIHRYVGGLSLWSSGVAIISGVSGHNFNSNGDGSEYGLSNFLSSVRIFQHEFSHLFGLPDGNCSLNQPCIMSGGFDGVVHAGDVWCDACKARFEIDRFDASEGE